MYRFDMNSNCAVSSSASREEAFFACAQFSSVLFAIIMGISVLVSIFVIIDIAGRVSISVLGLILLGIILLALHIILMSSKMPLGGKPCYTDC